MDPQVHRAQRVECGARQRERVPLAALAEVGTGDDRDPLALLESQAGTRIPELVPVRYGRMATSPFAFFRGAALVMADDLARLPSTGLCTQLCGDAHLSNFGLFATPERRLAFDVNDFDETYPGPFEWDVRRLVASLAIAGRGNGFKTEQRHRITKACAAEYRETMKYQAGRGELDVWYSHLEAEAEMAGLREILDASTRKRVEKTIDKAWGRDSAHALSKLTTTGPGGQPRIVSTPPLIVPVEELFTGADAEQVHRTMMRRLIDYRSTLQPDRHYLLDRFDNVHAARKVVGVGTRCWIVLLRGPGGDPLFLQAKEAQPSVLAGYLDGSGYENRVTWAPATNSTRPWPSSRKTTPVPAPAITRYCSRRQPRAVSRPRRSSGDSGGGRKTLPSSRHRCTAVSSDPPAGAAATIG